MADETAVGAEIDDHQAPDPRAGGRFSLNEDWAATIAGLGILIICMLIGLVI